MQEYQFQVLLNVVVPAFDEGDAMELVQEVFGVGENYGTQVTDVEYTYNGPTK